MQSLTLAMIVAVTIADFLVGGDYWGRWAVLPGFAKFLPELFSLIAVLVVVIGGTRNRFRFVRPQYWLVLGALLITIVCGVFANSVAPGPIFAGTRTYLRAIVWFLVPAVYAYGNQEVWTQLKLLAAIAVLQLPLAVQQRLATTGQGGTTGDWVTGTLLGSSTLSIYLIWGLAIAAAMLVRKKLSVKQFVLLAVLLFVPTTINETKGTLVLLPLALPLAFLAAAAPGRRLRAMLWAVGLMAVLGAAFFSIYDYYRLQNRYAVPLTEFLSDPERVERYMSKDADVGTTGKVGRMDAFVVPLRQLSADPVTFAFGYGIGNVSHSALGKDFTGEHFELYGPFLQMAFSRLVLELGALGTLLVFTLLWLIFRDSRVVARQRDDVKGALAAGWVGVTAVFGVCMFYKDVIAISSLSYLFWYFSGLIAAARMRGATTT